MYYNLICIVICTRICTKFYSCKKWVLHPVPTFLFAVQSSRLIIEKRVSVAAF
jgi:hypothetical protein